MVGSGFSSFVVLAEMRTGSNFLEQNVNQFADLCVYGELFNPHFVGGANRDELFGITLKAREKDPFALLAAIKQADPAVIPGFRFFHDHDPRVLEHVLADPECAKVVLTRNALDSYVSRKIAAVTGQWKLTNLKHKKTAKIEFDAVEFREHIDTTQAFQVQVLNALQISGQTGFYIHYDDLQSPDILNGLGQFLGSAHQVDGLSRKMKRQNPAALESKVANHSEMLAALEKMDFLGLSRTPNFEPRRGAGVPQFILGNQIPVLFVPVKGGPVENVKSWLAAQDSVAPDGLLNGLNQKELRQWRQDHPGFQAISVLRHPVTRAHFSFCEYILSTQTGAYREIRESLRKNFGVRVPKKGGSAGGYDLAAHKSAFLAFLKFLKANLSGQTSLRIDPAWASQTAILTGASAVIIPGNIIHEAKLEPWIAHLENLLDLPKRSISPEIPRLAFDLAEIYDADIEARIRAIYARDYLNFGFGDWMP